MFIVRKCVPDFPVRGRELQDQSVFSQYIQYWNGTEVDEKLAGKLWPGSRLRFRDNVGCRHLRTTWGTSGCSTR